MKKSTLPVSKKFYCEIRQRVVSSVSALNGGSASECDLIMAAIDLYITTGTHPSADADLILLLTFNLLRPEIDKAITRSSRARQRAARNSKNKKTNDKAVEHMADNDNTSHEEAEEARETETPLNRRQRRLIDQACKRVARKLARRRA